MSKVLVVEDDINISMGIEFTLNDEGFEVITTTTKEDAIKKIDEDNFSLILLDVMLPDGNGYEICKYIRKSSEVPIIFLTACDEEVNIVMGLELGADDYISKPFKIKELLARIKANIRRYDKNSNKDIIKMGNLLINTNEAVVKKNNRDAFLTTAEYKLLLLFVQNPNVVITRSQILERLWDVSGEFVNDNTLTVYIKRLREKVEDNPSKPELILTVRGLGYKWNG